MASQPLISVVIPVYNGSRYLRQAIDSALGQTYPHVEVLVINDGSQDGGATEQVARSYGGRIRYYEKPNGGVATALNLGAREMRGEFYSWLSHDDVFLPDKLETQIAFWGSVAPRDGRCILYGDYDIIDSESKPLGTCPVSPGPPHGMRYHLLRSYPVNGCTTLLPRSCFTEVGLFDESLRTTQDYHFWFRAAGAYSYHHLPRPLLQARAHADQGTHRIREHRQHCEELYLWMLRQLTDEDLMKGAGTLSAAAAYLGLALALRLTKNAPRAAAHALACSRKQAARQPPLSRFLLRAMQQLSAHSFEAPGLLTRIARLHDWLLGGGWFGARRGI